MSGEGIGERQGSGELYLGMGGRNLDDQYLPRGVAQLWRAG